MTVYRRGGWRLASSANGRERVSDSLTTSTDPQASRRRWPLGNRHDLPINPLLWLRNHVEHRTTALARSSPSVSSQFDMPCKTWPAVASGIA